MKQPGKNLIPALNAITIVSYRRETFCLFQQILAPDTDKNHNKKAELLTVLWWSVAEREP